MDPNTSLAQYNNNIFRPTCMGFVQLGNQIQVNTAWQIQYSTTIVSHEDTVALWHFF
jgi:hypothetical protein